MKIPFDQREIDEAVEVPAFFGLTTKAYKYPITPKEATKLNYQRKPIWQIMGMSEMLMVTPEVIPDNIARGFVFDGTNHPRAVDHEINPDMFGIEWEFIEQVGGSMVRPGKPALTDANDWKKVIKFPDIETWDWEGCAEKNKDYLNTDKFVCFGFLTGWFERLISWMDFEQAAFALVDDDQVDAVKEIFMALSDLYIKIFEKCLKYFPQIDGFSIHDDWGGQKSCFFSPATAEDVIVPAMKKVTDYLHSRGIWCELHSCGQEFKQVPNFIKAGWDSWSGQPMNDTHTEYELYGDKIIIGVIPDELPPDATDDDARAAARAFVDKFCSKDKPCTMGYGNTSSNQAFRDEVYKLSRIKYGA